jgi:Rps23 Pro-64 3,4-dihydroxylase Tpa1-like proline 4-hydroxylase
MTTYTTENATNFFVEVAKDIPHGNSTLINHSLGVFNILKELGAPEEICLAGLYHSIYGNEYFNANVQVTRDQIRELIGLHAETLVYAFNTITNRDERLLDQEQTDELFFISYANIKEQSSRNHDPVLHTLLKRFESRLNITTETVINNEQTQTSSPVLEEFGVEHTQLDGKDIFIFDDLIERNHNDLLNSYCLNSRYTCEHSSNQFNVELDSRFISNMSREDFTATNLTNVIKQVTNVLGKKLHLGNFYINHYAPLTNVSRHTDSSFENTYTVLVFCNKYWEDTWGGELKFYSEHSALHNTIDFVPGRVVVFDSRIEHKVMPLTGVAKKSRFSIAVKCATDAGLEELIKMYGSTNLISID